MKTGWESYTENFILKINKKLQARENRSLTQ